MVSSPASQSPHWLKPLLAAGLGIALVSLLLDFSEWVPSALVPPALMGSTAAPSRQSLSCTTVVEADSQISREQLAQLLAIPERDPKARVVDLLAEPYCQLPSLQVRAGVLAERAAYPLAFDPAIQLVILYENDEYAGYRFSFE